MTLGLQILSFDDVIFRCVALKFYKSSGHQIDVRIMLAKLMSEPLDILFSNTGCVKTSKNASFWRKVLPKAAFLKEMHWKSRFCSAWFWVRTTFKKDVLLFLIVPKLLPRYFATKLCVIVSSQYTSRMIFADPKSIYVFLQQNLKYSRF